MILMKFLNNSHFNKNMSPLELEVYHHMKNIIGIEPRFFEYALMVDADTEVLPDSLNRMVAVMIRDSRVRKKGECGDTCVRNRWRYLILISSSTPFCHTGYRSLRRNAYLQ